MAQHAPSEQAWFPSKNCDLKNLWLPKWAQAGPPSSSCGCQPNPKGVPVFFVTSQSSSRKIYPLLRFLPRSPRVSLISTPMRPRLSASQRLPCAPRRCKTGKKRVAKRQLNQHFTVALRKHHRVRAVLLLWGEDWWSPRPMAENLTAPTRWRGKPTWMRRQSGWKEREGPSERGRAGW